MSQFFDQASLVMVPSGYKTGKVYSQKPLSTDGELTFTRASTATRVNSSGLIETVASNVPRLDYLNSSCPRLLLEPQRTNSLWYSEQFNQSATWAAENGTQVTANTTGTTDPAGGNAADIITLVSGAVNQLRQIWTSTSGTTYTASIFLKNIALTSGQTFLFSVTNQEATANQVNCTIDLANVTITTATQGAGVTVSSAALDNYGNGWYRARFTFSFAVGGNISYIRLRQPLNVGTNYAFYAWGAQLEAGAYATSYIPTLGAAVTRGVDDCVKSSATSIIGQTEGVVYFEWEYQNVGSSGGNIPISLDGAGGDEIYFWVQTNGTYNFDVGDSGSGVVGISGSMGSFGTKKIAFAYKNNDFALYINGVLAGTDTSGTVPTCNRLYVGRYWANTSYNIASGIKQVLLFPTRLSNADLAALTA